MPLPPLLPPLEARPSVTKGGASKTRILVAEDDEVSREIICARLESWGYAVVAARNGSEAMNELRKPDAPSIAILDWMMPEMDGLEVCRRTREVNRSLYAILLTARGGTENLVEGLSAGADAYLVKPVDKKELRAVVLVGLRVMAERLEIIRRVQSVDWIAAAMREDHSHLAI